jgi:effector-binding domain-containing protein
MERSDSTDPRIVELAAMPTLAVRVRQPMAELDLGALFGQHLPALARHLADLGAAPGGPPYGRYHEFGSEWADVEIGLPTAAHVAAMPTLEECEPGEMGLSQLPGGQAALTVHRGSYETLGDSYRRLEAWIGDAGRAAGGAPWESYVDDPEEVDVAELRTELYWPLA